MMSKNAIGCDSIGLTPLFGSRNVIEKSLFDWGARAGK